jgi:hypothetical protein
MSQGDTQEHIKAYYHGRSGAHHSAAVHATRGGRYGQPMLNRRGNWALSWSCITTQDRTVVVRNQGVDQEPVS